MCRKARETIQRLVSKIQGGPLDNDGPDSVATGQIELMVPGGKVGLIIGKSGETIKQLQVWVLSMPCVCFILRVANCVWLEIPNAMYFADTKLKIFNCTIYNKLCLRVYGGGLAQLVMSLVASAKLINAGPS